MREALIAVAIIEGLHYNSLLSSVSSSKDDYNLSRFCKGEEQRGLVQWYAIQNNGWEVVVCSGSFDIGCTTEHNGAQPNPTQKFMYDSISPISGAMHYWWIMLSKLNSLIIAILSGIPFIDGERMRCWLTSSIAWRVARFRKHRLISYLLL